MPRLGTLPVLLALPTVLCLSATDGATAYADTPVTHHATVTKAVHGAVRSVVVRGDVGEVTVVPGKSTRVVARERWGVDNRPSFTVTRRSGTLTVRTHCPGTSGGVTAGDQSTGCSADLVVTVPAAAAVNAVASTGDLRVSRLHGALTLRTGTGDLTVSRVSTSKLAARTGTGDIAISVPAGAYDYRLSSGGGDTRASGVTLDRRAARSVRAVAGAGDVSLTGY